MKSTRKNIKPYKGRLIRISYTNKKFNNKYNKTFTGRITKLSIKNLTFITTELELELSIKYPYIKSIEVIKFRNWFDKVLFNIRNFIILQFNM